MRVVVFGCGRTGSTLALELGALGHQIVIIEQRPAALRRLGESHNCEIVIGSGIDEDILEKARVRDCDVFFSVTRGDNTNIMAAQIVRLKYGVAKVCIKVADPLRADAYRKLGYFCITPSALTAGMMRDWILEQPYQQIDSYNVLYKELEL
ncbi:MAG TPA: TrkA family potassium uptake protein [Fimbriimonadaceae bacterium]|nr:TrkA family potassium uptake protein [Fimbriimonadaceae bacterium]